jgi:hypothetical protein
MSVVGAFAELSNARLGKEHRSNSEIATLRGNLTAIVTGIGRHISVQILLGVARGANELDQLPIDHVELAGRGIAFEDGHARLVLRVGLQVIMEIGALNRTNPVPATLQRGAGAGGGAGGGGGRAGGGGRLGRAGGRHRGGRCRPRLALRVVYQRVG